MPLTPLKLKPKLFFGSIPPSEGDSVSVSTILSSPGGDSESALLVSQETIYEITERHKARGIVIPPESPSEGVVYDDSDDEDLYVIDDDEEYFLSLARVGPVPAPGSNFHETRLSTSNNYYKKIYNNIIYCNYP